MGSSSSKQEQKATSTPYKHVWEVQGVKDIDGNTVDMSKFNNKVLLIVNIATKNHKCSVQLGELSALEKQYKSQGLEVLLFPCNDFKHQPDDVSEVKAACESAGFEGHLMEFVHVRGAEEHPLFVFLRLTNPTCKLQVGTDLNKIVVNKRGTPFGTWGQGGDPHALEQYIKQALGGRLTMNNAAAPRPAATAH